MAEVMDKGCANYEGSGRVLPGGHVAEDGFMRINGQILDSMLDGEFNDKIKDFWIIDCRFDYEYNGGHIPGAVNISTVQAIEEMLLGPSSAKPSPSLSGNRDRETVLVFYCEFSLKRSPTIARYLRGRDRTMNICIYPKIHYPEIYILEGGYAQFFQRSGARCQPSAYVTMDDPRYRTPCSQQLNQFDKEAFGLKYGPPRSSQRPRLDFAQRLVGWQTRLMEDMVLDGEEVVRK